MNCCIDDGGMWGQCIKFSEECLIHQAQSNMEFSYYLLWIGVIVLSGATLLLLVISLINLIRDRR